MTFMVKLRIRKKLFYFFLYSTVILLSVLPLLLKQPLQNFYINLFRIVTPLIILFFIARIYEYRGDKYQDIKYKDIAIFLGATIFLFWIGEVISIYYMEIGEDSSLGTIFYFVAYFPVFYLIFKYVVPYVKQLKMSSLLLLFVSLTFVAILIFYFPLQILLLQGIEIKPSSISFFIICSALDTIMLFTLGLLLLIYYVRETTLFWLAIAFCIFFGIVGDTLYFYTNFTGVEKGYIITEVIFNLMYGSLVIGLHWLVSEKPHFVPLSKYKRVVSSLKKKIEATKEQIEMERKQLLSIFEGIDEPIYVADPKTYEILYANGVLRKEVGYDIIGMKCYEVLQGRDKPCDFCTNDKIFGENFGKTYVWEWQNLVNKRWYRCIDRGIKWPDGREVRLEIAIDITDKVKAEEKIKKALEREREFKLKTAHYFFNPMAIAKGYLEIALEEKNVEDKILKAIEAINRVERVIKNIVTRGEIKE